MTDNNMVYFARSGSGEELGDRICMRPDMANKHGFICGATGTGKSVTLKVLAESFSALGVPVFMSDVKGDMAGIAVPGDDNEGMQKRIARFEIADTFKYQGYPVSIFDIYSQKGTPLRTTVSEMGPLLMAQVLNLNDTQTELLQVIYKIADDKELILTDTKDLKAILQYSSDHSDEFKKDYGNIPDQSTATIIRAVVALEAEGADSFFGEPAIDINDFFATAEDGRGIVTILDAETLISHPRLYSAFMLYLLSELFELLPEVGDPEKPKIVFFFDEAHLLFKNASSALLDKIEQVVKLIRSKGVSIFFVTQSPGDIPSAVMSQLGNKIEHALHAYTPAEQKVVRAAADAFRVNPEFDTEELIQNLGTGEAVVSVLDEKGAPSVAEHAYILPPESRMGALEDGERAVLLGASRFESKYRNMVDNESAYEVINKDEITEAAVTAQVQCEPAAAEDQPAFAKGAVYGDPETARGESRFDDIAEAAGKMMQTSDAKRVARTAGGTIGREIGKTIGEAVLGKKGRTIGGNIGAEIGRNISRNLLGTISKNK